MQVLLSAVSTLGSCQQLSSAQQYVQGTISASCVVTSCSEQLPAALLHTANITCRLHNLAHVELNAVDLAWDTVARFSHLGLEQVSQPPSARHGIMSRASSWGSAYMRVRVVRPM